MARTRCVVASGESPSATSVADQGFNGHPAFRSCFFGLIATKGRHEFFERERWVRDVPNHLIRYAGYSISYRQGVDKRLHVSVRIVPNEYLRLKAFLVEIAAHRLIENLVAEFAAAAERPGSDELPAGPFSPAISAAENQETLITTGP